METELEGLRGKKVIVSGGQFEVRGKFNSHLANGSPLYSIVIGRGRNRTVGAIVAFRLNAVESVTGSKIELKHTY